MQNRQQIREQMGVLEERLEMLGSIATANERDSLASSGQYQFGADLLVQDTLEAMRELSHLVHEQQLFKSVPAHDFLIRLCGLLVQDASAQGVDVALALYGEGRISMEMAEIVMGAIVAGFRTVIRNQARLSRSDRLKNHLFATGSIYLEVRSTSAEVLFRLIDDGQEAEAPDRVAISEDKRFQKLREHIARCGGWFGHKTFAPHGGMIEFKVPLAHNRMESLLIRQGSIEMLVPSSCIVEMLNSPSERKVPEGAVVLQLHETDGLVRGDLSSPVLLRVGVADFQFWIACDSVSGPVKTRRTGAESFMEEGCWLKNLGLFHEEGLVRALPFLDGATLAGFFKSFGDAT